jgi:putative endonuclease
MHQVYIIFSQSLQRHYTGFSEDFEKRLIDHNAGLSKYTSKGIPWSKIWLSEPMTKAEAVLLEKKIKRRGAHRYLESLKRIAKAQ